MGSDFREYCDKFNTVWEFLKENSTKTLEEMVTDICSIRNYYGMNEYWIRLFKEVGLAYVDSEEKDLSVLEKSGFSDLGLFSENKSFLLSRRFIIPVKDMLGNVISLIGWYPDGRKYITTPSKYFDRDSLFLGMEQFSKTGLGGKYFLVEGVFDSYILRALGYNAIAQMGIASGKRKEVLYSLIGRIVAIPDNDSQGRKVIEKDMWNLPYGSSYLKWSGGFSVGEDDIHIKDIDGLCKMFDVDSVKGMLDKALLSRDRIINIRLE